MILSSEMQRLLCRWIVKTAVILERSADGRYLAPPSLIEAVWTGANLTDVYCWALEATGIAAPDMLSTREIVLPTVDGLVRLRLSLFNVYEFMCVCLFGADKRSARWLALLDIGGLLGPGVRDTAMLPCGPPVPVPSTLEFKDFIHECLRDMTDDENERRLASATGDEQSRLHALLEAAARGAAPEEA